MDGVLVDGEPLHFEALNTLLAEEGHFISLEAYKPYMGTKTGWADMMRDFNLSKSDAYYAERYHELILNQYRTCAVAEPGATDLVRAIRRRGMPVGVASSSRDSWVAACLERIEILHEFDAVVTGSDVENGKPAPDIYLLAANRLGVEPGQCLAIEDALAGIESAKNAGMTCWAVRTEYTRGLVLPAPHREFERLADIALTDILGVAA